MKIFRIAIFFILPLNVAAQTFRTDDPVLRSIWDQGMENSQTEQLAHELIDVIGPRLSGTPGFTNAVEWITGKYNSWGIDVRQEQYGTWNGWEQGVLHVDMIEPRVQTLNAHLLAWSPGSDGPIEGEVVAIPAFADESEVEDWLGSIRGKVILAAPAEITCRAPESLESLARESTVAAIEEARRASRMSFGQRMAALGNRAERVAKLEEAGIAAVLSSNWSNGWGVNKIFSASTETVPMIDLSCEDYGLLSRLAESGNAPRVRINAEARDLGTVPMHNVIATIPGTELPDEYVMLSAHLDSWHGATGATDNGTGSVMMLEAMRLLKEAYPNPRRTILVGHWGAEEQGLIGSRAFAEDHPEVVENLQVLFNQDNGTWRIEYIQTQGLIGATSSLARWMAQVPTEISENVELDLPGPQERGGSDHVSFLCHGAPGFRLQSNYPDYRQYTWHTNLDTYDKIVFDDLKNNATLAAMLIYLASEDPERVSRERSLLPPAQAGGEPREWLSCRPARRSAD